MLEPELLLEEELLELEELELLEEFELLEELLDELELLELDVELVELPVSIVVPQLETISFTSVPAAVRSEEFQPLMGVPGLTIEEPSSLSLTAQFRCEILFCLRKFIHDCVSLTLGAPSPSAFTEPHSVTNSAMPAFMALRALSRNH